MGSPSDPILPSPAPYSRTYRRQRYPHFLNFPVPFISLICFIVSLQFFLLPRYFGTAREAPSQARLDGFYASRLDIGIAKCRDLQSPPSQHDIEAQLRGEITRQNPRWNVASGQQVDIFLKNATLFDGESWGEGPVNIMFHQGTITAISPTTFSEIQEIPAVEAESFIEVDLQGKYVTPGLVDMHSHHLAGTWPGFPDVDDFNEMHPDTGPLTPFVRVLDALKAYDFQAIVIASGGVTSSLVLPGSSNIMGGEAIMVKNILKGGEHGEYVVEEVLLEHGISPNERKKYMKMACGENPITVFGPGRTRMGNAWKFRHQMERARAQLSKQDEWCLSAAAAKESGNAAEFLEKNGDIPDDLELESSVAMLRGKIGVNIHCYEPEDMEDMIRHANEFGIRIQAFHHALDAWQVPEMIKDSGMNITVATFAEFGSMKKEAYGSNLWAGSILAKHGVPVAYKSDHAIPETSAKYLLYQAAVAHSFHLSEDLALQAVTSVPAKSLEQDHRVGYVRIGYDADIVVWDSHPLSIGATPLQVYIDGKAALDPKKVEESMPKPSPAHVGPNRGKPQMRATVAAPAREDFCSRIEQPGQEVVITGIARSYLEDYSHNVDGASSVGEGALTMILTNNKVTCFGPQELCWARTSSANPTVIALKEGHVLPGLTTLSNTMGIMEMAMADSTGDGMVSQKLDPLVPENVVYAKYGIHLEGKSFSRARIGGVTRAITPPYVDFEDDGFLSGVSVGFKVSGKRGLLDGGIFRDDVGLHFTIGQGAKEMEAMSTVSTSVAKLRRILSDNKGKDNIYGKAFDGSIPLIIHAENKYDIMQLIKIKQDYRKVNLVIYGGSGAPQVAKEIAEAAIPVILTENRGAPSNWERKDTLVGPPLTKSAAAILSEAGVHFGIAFKTMGDAHIHNLALEASWTAKFAGLSNRAAVELVSRKIEKILDLDLGKKGSERDFVIWEGDPLEFGASVVLAVDGERGEVLDCWPEAL